MQNTNSPQKFSRFHSCRTQDHNIHASFGLGDIYLGWKCSDLFVWDRYLEKSFYLHIFLWLVSKNLCFSRCLGGYSKHVDISYLCLSSKTSWNWRANKQHSHKKNMLYIHKHFHNSWVLFSNTLFRLCMVHVKESGICRLAYSRAYMAIFLADACRLKSIGIQAQNQGLWKQETILYANFSFDCFSNVCTFQDTFEGSHDVSADSKLVDISYCCFSSKTGWNWGATRSHKKAYIQTHICNYFRCIFTGLSFYFVCKCFVRYKPR